MKVFFMNNGDFDVRAMLTMGVSAKGSDDAIGFFGTGFKYAVSIILRGGGTVKISTVSGVYKFESRKESIRGKEFDIVYCNDREAGFTTHLGANWKPWMAFRELYCNAKDEGGEISDKVNLDFDTIVQVESQEIYQAYVSRSDYFLEGNPIIKHSACEIHKGGKPYIYYKGIAIMDAYDNQTFAYNILSHVQLTEDRTCASQHNVRWPIQKALQSLSDKAMLRQVLKFGEQAEAKLGFDTDWPTSDEFLQVCSELEKTDYGICESARTHYKKLAFSSGDFPEFKLTPVQSKMLDKAKEFLFNINVPVDDYPVKAVTGLGEGVMGRALDGVIYLSEMPFNMGAKQLASTLMEEWVHCKTGARDFDRNMQNWLFDKILSLAEEINGEPL